MKTLKILMICVSFAASCCAKSLPKEPGAKEVRVAQGDLLPFEMADYNTKDHTIYKTTDHPGAVFVLEYYGNFCGPCNENVPNIDDLVKEYKDRTAEVQILDVSIDQDDDEYTDWIDKHHPTYPVLADKSRSESKKLKIKYIPTINVVDCGGNLTYQYVGILSGQHKKDVREAIEKAVTACKPS